MQPQILRHHPVAEECTERRHQATQSRPLWWEQSSNAVRCWAVSRDRYPNPAAKWELLDAPKVVLRVGPSARPAFALLVKLLHEQAVPATAAEEGEKTLGSQVLQSRPQAKLKANRAHASLGAARVQVFVSVAARPAWS